MEVRSPLTMQEWDHYFNLRWQILRAPWNQAKGTEKDEIEHEKNTFHAMALNIDNQILGVARLHLLTENKAQIRYMAVSKQSQGLGIGKLLINYLEAIAKSQNVNQIVLQSRENAVDFYIKHNYKIIQKSFIMYNEIQHYLMEKSL
jgi:ribosomal protein S18 acetylase RimI-like enzyme